MNTKFIDTPQYYLKVIADIKAGDLCLLDNNVGESIGYEIKQCLNANVSNGEYTFKENDGSLFTTGMCDKIIAHYPKSGQPVLEGVPLLPGITSEEDEIEELAADDARQTVSEFYPFDRDELWYKHGIELAKRMFKHGYKAALQSDKKYSEEDVRLAIEMSKEREYLPHNGSHSEPKYNTIEIIQSLTPKEPTPIDFIIEWEKTGRYNYLDGNPTQIHYEMKLNPDKTVKGTWKFKK